MNAVGKLGSYISRSVYTVSGPFHPFGGAVDIIVVEQPDGSFKSSPWYVRFGKFQGVLKAKEKVVSVTVNGVEADLHMYLDHKGEAHFIREVDIEDDDGSLSPPSSGEDTDGQLRSRWPVKSKSCNFDSHQSQTVTQIAVSDGNGVTRSRSRRSRILGFVLGRRSVKDSRFLEGDNDSSFLKKAALESAEIAADLLEIKWSRSLVSLRRRKGGVPQPSFQDVLEKNGRKDLVTDVQNISDSLKQHAGVEISAGSLPLQQIDSSNDEKNYFSHSSPIGSEESVTEAGMTVSCLVSTYVAGTSLIEGNNNSIMRTLSENEKLCVDDGGGSMNLMDAKFEAHSGEQFVLGNLRKMDVTSQTTFTTSTLCGLNFEPLLEDGKFGESESSLDTIGDPVGSYIRRSESPGAERPLFCDIDDRKGNEVIQREEAVFQHHEGECELLGSQVRTEEENASSVPNHVSGLSAKVSDRKDMAQSAEDMSRKLKTVSRDLNIHENVNPKEVSRTSRSLPNTSTQDSNLSVCGAGYSLKDARDWLQNNAVTNINSEADNDYQPSKCTQLTGDVRSIENLKHGSEYPTMGNSSRTFDASTKSWESWSFTSNRSRSMKWSEATLGDNRSFDAQNAANKNDGIDDESGVPKMKVTEKKMRTTIPTSEELKSLKLKEGTNTVAFTFSTPMLGKQQVDARIHLWKWDSRIVISDVDGTITRSDLLGQVMPLVGVDWSQTGVAHLFSAIKENGYHVLFLSARAISQAYHTRQFLCNLKQDGKALPEGPVVISPDGLFPALYREVVRRAPHEFKISCLEAIKALFPPDRNPFYAGFGNRDTDEISYLKVGIPKGKIFIINPKGEIVVDRHVDRKSYTSLHAVVNDMFPLMSSSEQEDFNSWNYWKLPLPSIDI